MSAKATIAELQRTVEELRARLVEKNTLTAAVYVDGTDIAVLGIFDSSAAGKDRLEQLEDTMEGWGETKPRTANWLVSDPILLNVVEESAQ